MNTLSTVRAIFHLARTRVKYVHRKKIHFSYIPSEDMREIIHPPVGKILFTLMLF